MANDLADGGAELRRRAGDNPKRNEVQRGASAAVQMLKACGVDRFFSVNVLADEAIRQGIKDYANWPTIPQLYVSGEFVGGSDIMREMYESGELQQLLSKQAA